MRGGGPARAEGIGAAHLWADAGAATALRRLAEPVVPEALLIRPLVLELAPQPSRQQPPEALRRGVAREAAPQCGGGAVREAGRRQLSASRAHTGKKSDRWIASGSLAYFSCPLSLKADTQSRLSSCVTRRVTPSATTRHHEAHRIVCGTDAARMQARMGHRCGTYAAAPGTAAERWR